MGLTDEDIRQLRVSAGALILRSGPTAWYAGIGRAIQAIRWLDDRGYQVKGLEGFVCNGSRIQHVEGFVADLSDVQAGDLVDTVQEILAEWDGHVEWLDISPVVGG